MRLGARVPCDWGVSGCWSWGAAPPRVPPCPAPLAAGRGQGQAACPTPGPALGGGAVLGRGDPHQAPSSTPPSAPPPLLARLHVLGMGGVDGEMFGPLCSPAFKRVQIWGRGSLEGFTPAQSAPTPSHRPSVHRAGSLTQVSGSADGFGCESRGRGPQRVPRAGWWHSPRALLRWAGAPGGSGGVWGAPGSRPERGRDLGLCAGR